MTRLDRAAIIAGVDWVTGNHQAGQPAVANMSLGGGANAALDTAVRNMIADGVSAAIAAGKQTFWDFRLTRVTSHRRASRKGLPLAPRTSTMRRHRFRITERVLICT